MKSRGMGAATRGGNYSFKKGGAVKKFADGGEVSSEAAARKKMRDDYQEDGDDSKLRSRAAGLVQVEGDRSAARRGISRETRQRIADKFDEQMGDGGKTYLFKKKGGMVAKKKPKMAMPKGEPDGDEVMPLNGLPAMKKGGRVKKANGGIATLGMSRGMKGKGLGMRMGKI